jgi:hypothetical protein
VQTCQFIAAVIHVGNIDFFRNRMFAASRNSDVLAIAFEFLIRGSDYHAGARAFLLDETGQEGAIDCIP